MSIRRLMMAWMATLIVIYLGQYVVAPDSAVIQIIQFALLAWVFWMASKAMAKGLWLGLLRLAGMAATGTIAAYILVLLLEAYSVSIFGFHVVAIPLVSGAVMVSLYVALRIHRISIVFKTRTIPLDTRTVTYLVLLPAIPGISLYMLLPVESAAINHEAPWLVAAQLEVVAVSAAVLSSAIAMLSSLVSMLAVLNRNRVLHKHRTLRPLRSS